MSKPVKDMITSELRERFGGLENALWLEFSKVDGVTTNQLRRLLRGKQMRMEVVKNSLFRRAVGDGALKPLAEALSGPAAVITGGDSMIEVAKVLEEWMPKIPGLKFKGAVLEGEWLDESRVAFLSRMESKADLHAKVAAIVLSPGGKIAAAIRSGGANVAGAVKAMIEKLEKGEEIKKVSA